MLQWKSRTCLPILNVVHQYPIHCHYPLLLSNKLSLSIIIIQYLVIIHYHYPLHCHYPLSLSNTLSVSQVQDRPGRSLAYILPSLLAATVMNIPRWINTKYTQIEKWNKYYIENILLLSCTCDVLLWFGILTVWGFPEWQTWLEEYYPYRAMWSGNSTENQYLTQ